MSSQRSEAPVEAERGSARYPLGVLLVVCAGMFFGVLNAGAVGVVLAEIAADLDTSFGQIGWVMTGFLLVYGIAIPFYGRLADLYGARLLFLLGLGIFSVGSLLAALAPNFELLLAARVIQGAGGAAVPGLGMTLAIRAYGPAARGMVLGVIGATIGVGSAIGPLLGGLLSNAWGWEAIFAVNAAAAITIPFAILVLPRDEEHSDGRLDLIGGALLALAVVGVVLAPTEGSQSGWSSTGALAGIAMAVISLAALTLQQRVAASPFIPREFVHNGRLIAFVSMSFLVMAANAGALIGLPILLANTNGLGTLEVGLAMVPGAIGMAVLGVVSGRLVDSVGAAALATVGGIALLVSILGLSAAVGGDVRLVSALAGLLGASFGLINTPLATAVTRVVRLELLASAIGVNSMLFFVGGSVGAAALLGFATAGGDSSLNPLHSGAASGFSDGFLFLALPALAVIALASRLPGAAAPAEVAPEAGLEEAIFGSGEWRPDCTVPWAPTLEEARAFAAASGTPAGAR